MGKHIEHQVSESDASGDSIEIWHHRANPPWNNPGDLARGPISRRTSRGRPDEFPTGDEIWYMRKYPGRKNLLSRDIKYRQTLLKILNLIKSE